MDYLLSDTLDLVIQNGDFAKATKEQSDQQSSLLLINYAAGDLKHSPVIGVGINWYKNSSGKQTEIKRAIYVHHEADGFKINSVVVKNWNEFYLDAERK